MSLADPIGDMLTRIRNGQMRLLNNVIIPGSKFRVKILDVLKLSGNKKIEDIKYPIEPEEAFNQH